MPPIPDQPTRDDALRALALLEDLVCESPFEDEASKSVALSGLITPVVRGAMPVAPMHASSAPTAGTGKSFLWDLVAAISIGQRRIPVISAGNVEETEKRLAGVILTGQPLVSIDNVNGELKGDFLAQAIEQHYLDVRPLGGSKIVRVEAGSTTIFATGNNITIVGDLCRRTITSRLDAQLENPQLRQFKNDPIQTILNDRGKYIAACLTICRAYIVAGRPGVLPRAGVVCRLVGHRSLGAGVAWQGGSARHAREHASRRPGALAAERGTAGMGKGSWRWCRQ